ncbi:MAG: ATP-binding protein, partial [Halobaculum sp.]
MVEPLLLARATATGAGAALSWLAYRTYTRRGQPAASSYAILLASLGVTALCAGATAHTGTLYKLVWLYTGLAIPLALALFAFDYYGLSFFGSRTRAAAAATPAVLGGLGGTLVVLGTPRLSPGTTPPLSLLATLPDPVFGFAGTLNEAGLYYTTAVMLLAVGVVLRTVYRYDHLDSTLAPVVSFVGIWPWVANMFMPQVMAGSSLAVGVGAVAGGYVLSAVAAAVAVGPLSLFESSPMAGNVGPEVVLDSMDEAVIVVDDNRRVLRLNEVACETFGVAETAATAGPLSTVIDRPFSELEDGTTVPLETADGLRQFAVTRSTVRDRRGEDRGSALLFRDVTRERTREQRLDVFNRMLRHNLRNDASTIVTNARLIGDGGDPEACADRIVDTTTELVEAAERAREIDQISDAPADAATPVAPVVAEVTDEVAADYPHVEFTTAVPETTAAAARDVLEIVLRNLVENAAEHNDADEPLVVVSADVTDGSVEIAVADNGPGIPEYERDVLDAGEEDQLQHGSGLGLWTVYWGVTAAGGALRFSENDPSGSVVTVVLPTTDATDLDAQPALAAD